MQRKQNGFTLIELVVVIVILGILAVTALPKFVDLSGDARTAAMQGVVGALNSSASINYGAYKVSSARGTRLNAANVCTSTILQGSVIPSGYTVGGTGDCAAAGDGNVVSCSVTDANGTTGTASVICTN